MTWVTKSLSILCFHCFFKGFWVIKPKKPDCPIADGLPSGLPSPRISSNSWTGSREGHQQILYSNMIALLPVSTSWFQGSLCKLYVRRRPSIHDSTVTAFPHGRGPRAHGFAQWSFIHTFGLGYLCSNSLAWQHRVRRIPWLVKGDSHWSIQIWQCTSKVRIASALPPLVQSSQPPRNMLAYSANRRGGVEVIQICFGFTSMGMQRNTTDGG